MNEANDQLTSGAVSTPASGWTAGQRITMVSPERCKGMSGVISGVTGDGKTLLVQFGGNQYNSLVGSHQVKQSNEKAHGWRDQDCRICE